VLAGLAAGCIQEGPRPGNGDVAPDASDATGVPDGSGETRVEVVDCVGCIIADTCRGSGEVNATNPCELCDPARSLDGWSPALGSKPCEDADTCTETGVCSDGVCVAPLRPECDDLPECVTSVSCAGSDCSYVVRAGQCFIDGACFANGAGPAGAAGGATASLGDDACVVCDASADPRAWSLTNARCDDGDSCTYEDVCNDGVCAGQANDCADAFTCTLDFCDGGRCLHQIIGNQCLVDGVCFSLGSSRAGDPCHTCRPLVATDKLSLDVGAACDDQDSCTMSSACNLSGTCEGAPSDVDDEPNDGSATAQDVGIASVEGFPDGGVQGNIVSDDLDVFRWGMTFTNNGSFLLPKATVRFDSATKVELCLFARCGQVIGSFFSPIVLCGDDRAAGLDDKTPGCCAVFDADVEPQMALSATCIGGVVQGFAYARVSTVGAPNETTCGGYKLFWGTQ